MPDRVLILDFGSQVTQLIARRVRESGVYSEILPFNATEERIRAFAPKAVIIVPVVPTPGLPGRAGVGVLPMILQTIMFYLFAVMAIAPRLPSATPMA